MRTKKKLAKKAPIAAKAGEHEQLHDEEESKGHEPPRQH